MVKPAIATSHAHPQFSNFLIQTFRNTLFLSKVQVYDDHIPWLALSLVRTIGFIQLVISWLPQFPSSFQVVSPTKSPHKNLLIRFRGRISKS